MVLGKVSCNKILFCTVRNKRTIDGLITTLGVKDHILARVMPNQVINMSIACLLPTMVFNKLEAEADYFLIHDLRDQLRKKRYLDAVKTVVEAKVLPAYGIEGRWNQKRYDANEIQKIYEVNEVQSFLGSYSRVKRYRSPCEIHTKNDAPVRGCCSCEELIRAHGPQYDDPLKQLTLVTMYKSSV